ncbi:hypothetical protein FD05_GL000333 [Lentilactobacillus otakiensis DSM 19908 = JCM 15040]|nr:hypothetical protein FD05_GL000333 [Lentilactobacillus otakiensis DSM 19908 = JCM 15040]
MTNSAKKRALGIASHSESDVETLKTAITAPLHFETTGSKSVPLRQAEPSQQNQSSQ